MRGSIPDPPFQFAGRTWYSIPQVAAAYGLPAITVYQRLYLHWPLARALTAPVARRFRVKPRKTPEPFLQEGQWKVQIGDRYYQTAAEVAEVYGLHVNRVYATIRAADTPEAREYLLQPNLTDNPSDLISWIQLTSSACNVGSPPVMQTPLNTF